MEETGQRRGIWRASVVAGSALAVALTVPAVVDTARALESGIASPASATQTADRMRTTPLSTVTSPTSTTVPTTSSTTTTIVVKPGTLLFPMEPTPRCDILDSFGDSRSGHAHEGVDILATQGQDVYAVADGTLTKQYVDSDEPLAGNGWRLTLPDKTYYFYAHLSDFAPGLVQGAVVKRGDIIGYVGDTGNPSTGNYHLHFEYHPQGGRAVDPLDLFDIPAGCTIT